MGAKTEIPLFRRRVVPANRPDGENDASSSFPPSFLPIPCQPARARQAESAVRSPPSSPRQSDISHEMRFWVVVCQSEANGWSLSQLRLARCTDIICYLGYKIERTLLSSMKVIIKL